MSGTILLAGATGFIGSYVIEELLANSYKVVVLKRSASDIWRIEHLKSQTKTYDIDEQGMEQAFKENTIDWVMNFVTDYGRRKEALLSDLVETNVVFSVKLAELSVKYNVPHYGNIDTVLAPDVNHYAHTKTMAKNLLRDEFSSKMQIFNFRLEYVYGEKDDTSKFIPFAISKLKKNEDLDMTAGEQKLDFIHVKDCASAIVHVIKNHDLFKESFEEFQIGTGHAIALKDFVEELKIHFSSTSKINYGKIPYRPKEQMFSEADISRLEGWRVEMKLENLN